MRDFHTPGRSAVLAENGLCATSHPIGALAGLSTLLRPGGEVLVVEGDHGSCYFHPSTPEAVRAWSCLIQFQAALGGVQQLTQAETSRPRTVVAERE